MTTARVPKRAKGRPRSAGEVTCARCGDLTPKSTTKYRFPEGAICGRCYDRATHTHGQCTGCGAHRLLPGIDDVGRPICVVCAGIRRDFHCSRCGEERAIFRSGLCERCALEDDLESVLRLADRPGHDLEVLRDRLLESERPTSVLTWLRSAKVRAVLHHISHEETSLTHESFDKLPNNHLTRHLRALLVDVGVLPHRDEALVRFERWVKTRVAATPAHYRRSLEQFAVWYHLSRLRELASLSGDSQSPAHYAKQQITAAGDFLEWLEDQGISLRECTQSHVDIWLTTGPTTRYNLRGFLEYTSQAKLSRPLEVPRRNARSTRRMTADDRLGWIRHYLEDVDLKVSTRTAALILLLYGQPLVRIAKLRTEAITVDELGCMSIAFSDNKVPVPPPFDAVVLEHLASRGRTRTQQVGSNPFLFPGLRSGGHITTTQLKEELNAIGVDVLAARNTTLDELVTSIPAPLVARAMGFSFAAMGEHEKHQGVRFERYVHGRFRTEGDAHVE